MRTSLRSLLVAVSTAVATLSPGFVGFTPRQVAAQDSIPWYGNLAQAQQVAQQQRRLLLVHFWNDNCPPCVGVERNVFSRPEVDRTLAAGFVPVKIKVDDQPELARRFRIDRWPTDVILTADGQELFRGVSPQDPIRYIAMLERAAGPARAAMNAAPPVVVVNTQPAGPGGPQAGFQAGNPAGPQPGGYSQPDSSGGYVGPTQPAPSFGGNPGGGSFMDRGLATRSAPQDAPTNVNYAPAGYDRAAPNQVNPGGFAPGAAAQAAPQPAPQFGGPSYGAPAAPPAPAQGTQYQGYGAPANAPQGSAPQGYAPTGGPGAVGGPTNNSFAPPPPGSNGPAFQGAVDPRETRNAWAQNAPGAMPPNQNVAAGQAGNIAPPADLQQAAQAAQGNPPLGIDGFCPVTLYSNKKWRKGDPRFGAIHRDRTYLFADAASRDQFLANPDKYSPMLSGYDPVKFIDQGQLVVGRRQHGVWYHDQMYLFADEATLQRFWTDPERFVPRVEQAMRATNAGNLQR